MRSLILIFLTLAVLGGGFALYSMVQPPAAQKPVKSISMISRTPRPASTQSLGGIGGGNNPWIKRFKDGDLSSQFRGERYDPQQGDTVHVIKPQAEFFSRDGQQRLRIEGATGNVVVPLAPQDKPDRLQSGAAFQSPTRGKLQDVVLSMFEPADAPTPMLVARMNNAAFDNDTFTISTEAYRDEKGATIEADQVPVVVRGRDYDFDGRGLVMRWNERDQKLQLLEIAHGESLTVKNPNALSKLQGKPPATAPTADRYPLFYDSMLVSSDPGAVRLIADAPKRPRKKPANETPPPVRPPPTSRPRIVRDASPTVYRATFEKDVKIFEQDKQIVAADRINIDLLQEPSPDATMRPSSTQPGKASPSPRTRRPAVTAPATQAGDATAPVGPIVVRWTGKLRVAPLEGSADVDLKPGSAAVQMVGSPVVLMRDGTEARCGEAFYNSASGKASLRGTETFPVVTMLDQRGAKITTPQLNVVEESPELRIATLIGPSAAEIPVEAAAGKPEQHVKANWSKECRLRLIDIGGGNTAIKTADLSGDVKVQHPQLDMSSDQLTLAFDPPMPADKAATTKPSAPPPREIIATGNVRCRIIDPQHEQNITTQRLRVAMGTSPTGESYARLFDADGDVHTMGGGREMWAGHLAAELVPSTQPVATTEPSSPFAGAANVQIVSLIARDDVRLQTDDGVRATANSVHVQTVNGKEVYRLIGKPLATVGDEKTSITGPEISFRPDEKIAEILGPGKMHGVQPDDPKQAIDIVWQRGAIVNGETNIIDVAEKVVINTSQPDGTMIKASSDRLRAQLQAIPTTKPAEKQATSKSSAVDKMNFLGGKQITDTTLYGHVEVTSELLGPDGKLLRGMDVRSEAVRFNRVTQRMEVPVAGEMLYRDYRAPEATTAPAKEGDGQTLGSGRGSTAFKWSNWLVYDQTVGAAVIDGDVNVVHWPEQAGGQPFNLDSDQLEARLERDPAGKKDQFRLKGILAKGHVIVKSQRYNLDANELTYDPIQQLLTASGNDATPVNFFDHQTSSNTTAGEVVWNTKTDQIRVKQLSGKVRR